MNKQFKKSFEFLKERLIEQTQTGEKSISKWTFEKLLAFQGFEIEDEVVQQELQRWESIAFIEFVGEDDVYFKL